MVTTFSSFALDLSPLRRSSRTCLRASRYFLLKHQANVADRRFFAGLSAILIASRSCSKIAASKHSSVLFIPFSSPSKELNSSRVFGFGALLLAITADKLVCSVGQHSLTSRRTASIVC